MANMKEMQRAKVYRKGNQIVIVTRTGAIIVKRARESDEDDYEWYE